MNTAPVEALLREEIGLDAETIGRGAVARALHRVLGEHAAEAGAAERLRADPQLRRRLVEAVVVPETWFFRDGKPFELLVTEAKKRRARPLRVLSLPCSTGEEAWTIAITLREAGLAPDEFTVLARDVSATALRKARAGVYGPYSFRGAAGDWRARWLEPEEHDHWRVKEVLRGSVEFAAANLFAPVAAEPPCDFVFCRNLLIYFDAPKQREALARLRARMKPDALLFVGHAEAAVALREGFSPWPVAGAFAFTAGERAPHRAPSAAAIPARAKPRVVPARVPVLVSPPPARPAPVAAETDLARARRLADRGELAEATRLVRDHLEKSGPDAEAYCLLGVVHDAEGRAAEAEADYRRALYLEPRRAFALAHLALMLDARGEAAAARRLRARAGRGGEA